MAEKAGISDRYSASLTPLDRLVELFDEPSAGPSVPRDASEQARSRALATFEACGGGDGAAALARLGFAAEMLVAMAVDLAAQPTQAEWLIGQIEEVAEIPREVLGREVLRAPQLLQLPTAVAVEVELALLLVFIQARAVSLWTRPGGELKQAFHAGEPAAGPRSTRRMARELLERGAAGPSDRGLILGSLVDDWQTAALVIVRSEPRHCDHRLVAAAVPVLGVMLERDELLGRESWSRPSVVAAVERRLARLRFDLHDGPQQDVILLAADLRLFRDQLSPIVAGDSRASRLLGRLDDLDAQLVALDGSLRRLLTSVESPLLGPGALPDALAQITEDFAARTAIEPEVSLAGDLTRLTDSQQIALLALTREALSNVREHGHASRVTIRISAHANGVDAEVSDDGRGFNPETTLVRAARNGHLGLVGMHERVRLLGGSTRIDSRRGGPTVISVSLPAWPAVEPQPRAG